MVTRFNAYAGRSDLMYSHAPRLFAHWPCLVWAQAACLNFHVQPCTSFVCSLALSGMGTSSLFKLSMSGCDLYSSKPSPCNTTTQQKTRFWLQPKPTSMVSLLAPFAPSRPSSRAAATTARLRACVGDACTTLKKCLLTLKPSPNATHQLQRQSSPGALNKPSTVLHDACHTNFECTSYRTDTKFTHAEDLVTCSSNLRSSADSHNVRCISSSWQRPQQASSHTS